MPGRSFLGFRVTSMLTLAALLLAVASIPSAHAATTVDRFDVSMREYDDTGSLSRPVLRKNVVRALLGAAVHAQSQRGGLAEAGSSIVRGA